MSSPESEIDTIQTRQITSAIKGILKGIVNPSGARYFFLELQKVAQLQGEFFKKDNVLSFQEIDILKNRLDRTSKLLESLQVGGRSPSTTIRKEDIIEQEQSRLTGDIIYDLLQRTLSPEEALLVLKEQLQVSILKGKYQNEWSGKVDPEYRDEVLDKLYECGALLKKLKARRFADKRPSRELSRKTVSPDVKPSKELLKRPDYEAERGLSRKSSRSSDELLPRGSLAEKSQPPGKVEQIETAFYVADSRNKVEEPEKRSPFGQEVDRSDTGPSEVEIKVRAERKKYSSLTGDRREIEERRPSGSGDFFREKGAGYETEKRARPAEDLYKRPAPCKAERDKKRPRQAQPYRYESPPEDNYRKDINKKEEVTDKEKNEVSYEWGKFFEVASAPLIGSAIQDVMGGQDNFERGFQKSYHEKTSPSPPLRGARADRRFTADETLLDILDKLPVDKFSDSSELTMPTPRENIDHNRDKKGKRGKTIIKPDVLVDLLETAVEESIFLPGEALPSPIQEAVMQKEPFKKDIERTTRKDYLKKTENKESRENKKDHVPFEDFILNSDISKINNLSPISTGLRDGLYFLVWGELFNVSLKLDVVARKPAGGKRYSELYFLMLSRYSPLDMAL